MQSHELKAILKLMKVKQIDGQRKIYVVDVHLLKVWRNHHKNN